MKKYFQVSLERKKLRGETAEKRFLVGREVIRGEDLIWSRRLLSEKLEIVLEVTVKGGHSVEAEE